MVEKCGFHVWISTCDTRNSIHNLIIIIILANHRVFINDTLVFQVIVYYINWLALVNLFQERNREKVVNHSAEGDDFSLRAYTM